MLSPETIHTYVDILREELVPATGCTEPIAIAYAAALLRQTLARPRSGCWRRCPAISSKM